MLPPPGGPAGSLIVVPVLGPGKARPLRFRPARGGIPAPRRRGRRPARSIDPERPSMSQAPRIGFVSLGCPKALVDSERILSRLRAEGYETAADYAGADLVVVNTCGFLDSARDESLEAIGEALAENGRVIVTGCLGAEADTIREAHPGVLAVTGPHQYEA